MSDQGPRPGELTEIDASDLVDDPGTFSGGIKWGEDLDRDCAELRRLESYGIYKQGHHDRTCPLEHEGEKE